MICVIWLLIFMYFGALFLCCLYVNSLMVFFSSLICLMRLIWIGGGMVLGSPLIHFFHL